MGLQEAAREVPAVRREIKEEGRFSPPRNWPPPGKVVGLRTRASSARRMTEIRNMT